MNALSKPAPETAQRSATHTLFDRADHDFYPEPHWPVEQLVKALKWSGTIWDPACGFGTIPDVFFKAGFTVVGTDLVDRGYGTSGQNFLAFEKSMVRRTENIVCNPPFKLSIEFLEQAKRFTTDRVAFLLPLKWLASETRFKVFRDVWKPEAVFVLSNRLSMPPGRFLDPVTRLFNCDDPNPKVKEGKTVYRWRKGDSPSGGAIDFCWVVWKHGFEGETQLKWMGKGGVL